MNQTGIYQDRVDVQQGPSRIVSWTDGFVVYFDARQIVSAKQVEIGVPDTMTTYMLSMRRDNRIQDTGRIIWQLDDGNHELSIQGKPVIDGRMMKIKCTDRKC